MSGFTPPSIVVTGCGSVSAVGRNCEEAQKNLQMGLVQNRAYAAPFFPASFSAPCFPAAERAAHEYRLLREISESGFSGYNRTIQLALSALDEALTNGAYALGELRSRRVGIALGTTVGCTFHNEKYYIDWKADKIPDEAQLHRYLASNLAESIQTILGVQGPRLVITNACASGTDAIGMAKKWLENDLCDIAVAGGADELSRIACHGFNSLMLVAGDSCKPFDRDRRGLNLGEAAGIVVLEREERAREHDRKIFGRIRGYGVAGDGYHPTAPHPEGVGLQRAVAGALTEAAVQVGEIAMINAHGTGTRTNDKAETGAISALGFELGRVSVVSTKGATGHTLGAAGAIEAIFTLFALNSGEVYGTIGCEEPDPEFAFPVLSGHRTVALSGRIGVSQSLAFGGSNSALVIEGGDV